MRSIVPILVILLLCIAPVSADKSKGLFSGDILQADLDAFTGSTADSPSYIGPEEGGTRNLQDIAEWVAIGKTQLQNGNWASAEEAFSQVTQLDPKNNDGWEGYLLAIRGGGDFYKLLTAAEDAAEKDPGFVSIWKYKGIALSGIDRPEEALAAFDKALEVDPAYYQAWYYKGIAYDSLKRYDEAVRAYDQVLQVDSQHAKAWNNKGVALNYLARYDEAIAAFEKAIEIDPSYKTASMNKDVATEEKRKMSLGSGDLIDDSAVIVPSSGSGEMVTAVITMPPTITPTQISTPEVTALPTNIQNPTPTHIAPCDVSNLEDRSGELKEGEAAVYGYHIPKEGRTNIEWILNISEKPDSYFSSIQNPITDIYAFKDCNPKNSHCNTEFFAYGPENFLSIESPISDSTYYLMIHARLGSGTYNVRMNSYRCSDN